MNAKTQERIRAIAEEEYPGSEVKFAEDRDALQISLAGEIISRQGPPSGFKFADFDGLTDEQLHRWIRTFCAPE